MSFRELHLNSALSSKMAITAVFISIDRATLAPRKQRSRITTYLRSDRIKIRLIFFLIAFVDLTSFLSRPVSSCIVFMGNRHHISQEIKEVALKMSQEGLSDKQIEQVLGISGRTMRRLRAMHLKTGGVVRIPACQGRPRALDGLDARVGLFPLFLHCNTNHFPSFSKTAYSASPTCLWRNCRCTSLRLLRSRSQRQQFGGRFGDWGTP